MRQDIINNLLILPFTSLIIKYDHFFEGKIDFIIEEKKGIKSIDILKNDKIVIGTYDNKLKVYDPKAKKMEIIYDHQVRFIKILEDDRIVTTSDDMILRIWNSDTGECLTSLIGHDNEIIFMTILSNNRVASVQKKYEGFDFMGDIRIWNSITGICDLIIPGNEDNVLSIKYMDDKIIIILRDIYDIKIWNIDDGKLEVILKGHTKWVNVIKKYSNTQIITSSSDKSLRIWDISTGECQRILYINDSVECFLLLPFINTIIIGLCNGLIQIWKDMKFDYEFRGCERDKVIHSLTMSPDNRLISSADCVLKIWDLDKRKCVLTLLDRDEKFNGFIQEVKFLNNNQLIILSGQKLDKIMIWK